MSRSLIITLLIVTLPANVLALPVCEAFMGNAGTPAHECTAPATGLSHTAAATWSVAP